MCNWAEETTDLIILAFRVKIFQKAQKFSKKRPYVSRDELSSKLLYTLHEIDSNSLAQAPFEQKQD